MAGFLKISEATALAFHALLMIAEGDGAPQRTRDIATNHRASEAHLAKVLQRLVRAGMLKSTRGPGGGFILAQPPKEIMLIDVFTIFENCTVNDCLFEKPVCDGTNCVFRGLLDETNALVIGYLTSTSLHDLLVKQGKELPLT